MHFLLLKLHLDQALTVVYLSPSKPTSNNQNGLPVVETSDATASRRHEEHPQYLPYIDNAGAAERANGVQEEGRGKGTG